MTTEISALPASSEDDAPRRSTVAAASQLIVRTVAVFATSAKIALPNFLLAVVSWTFAQALAGCAAYGEAMYLGFVGMGEPVDQRDPVRGAPSERGNPHQPTSGLSEISSIANDKLGGRRPFLASRQTQSSAADLVKTEYTEQSEWTRAASAGSSTSTLAHQCGAHLAGIHVVSAVRPEYRSDYYVIGEKAIRAMLAERKAADEAATSNVRRRFEAISVQSSG